MQTVHTVSPRVRGFKGNSFSWERFVIRFARAGGVIIVTSPPIIQLIIIWLVVLPRTADRAAVLVTGEGIASPASIAGCCGWLGHKMLCITVKGSIW